MFIEAGVAVGYVIAWAVRKARRVGGRLDSEVDEVIDAGLDRLHEVVAAKLHGVMAPIIIFNRQFEYFPARFMISTET